MRRTLHGHLWTFGPTLRDALWPIPGPEDRPWSTTFEPSVGPRSKGGEITLRGRLHAPEGARSLVLIVHGLGGSLDSRYVRIAARAARTLDMAYLRLNLRGACREGEGLYHAGLTEDVVATLRSPELAGYEQLLLLGYSMGGHMLLRYAAREDRDPRVRALATVCSPLDLARGAREIHRPAARPYESHVLDGLKEIYAATAARRGPLLPDLEIDQVRSIYEWDARVIAPLFGYRNAEHYYRANSAGPTLEALSLRTLFVAAEADPMVLAGQLRPWLEQASPALRAVWTGRGGHVGFPEGLNLGLGAPAGANLHAQVLHWLRASLSWATQLRECSAPLWPSGAATAWLRAMISTRRAR